MKSSTSWEITFEMFFLLPCCMKVHFVLFFVPVTEMLSQVRRQARGHAGTQTRTHGLFFWLLVILRSSHKILRSSPEDSASRERSLKIFGLCHLRLLMLFLFCLCPKMLFACLVCPPPPRAWLVYSYVLFFIFYLRPLGVTRLACDTLVDLVSFSCVWFFVLMCLVFLFPPKFRRSNLFRLLVWKFVLVFFF